jgi:hypothetical protein
MLVILLRRDYLVQQRDLESFLNGKERDIQIKDMTKGKAVVLAGRLRGFSATDKPMSVKSLGRYMTERTMEEGYGKL